MVSYLSIPVARYAIPVAHDAIPVARNAICVAHDGGNLHLSGTVYSLINILKRHWLHSLGVSSIFFPQKSM